MKKVLKCSREQIDKQSVYYQQNREQRLAYAAAYRAKNNALLREKDRVRSQNEERAQQRRASRRKRKAMLKWGTDGIAHNAEDVARLFVLQDGSCAYCGIVLQDYHVDHIVPLARGGGNGPDNICLACPACNLNKKDKLFGYEWCTCSKPQRSAEAHG